MKDVNKLTVYQGEREQVSGGKMDGNSNRWLVALFCGKYKYYSFEKQGIHYKIYEQTHL